MKILLINSNPVVSRLTALSARKEEIQIDEVQEINEINNSKYDIVFVDADSWSKELDSAISKDIQAQKRVLFYAQDDKNNKELFDISILKPFLPSEVSAVIRSVEEYAVSAEESKENLLEVEEESIFNVLDTPKEEKKEEFLLSLDDDIELDKKEVTSVDKLEKENKLEDKEEDLFAELKESSSDFDQQLEEAFPLKKEEDLFDLDFSDDVLEKEFDALDKEKKSDTKKVEEIAKEELFDFDLDNNGLDLNLDVLSDDKISVETTPTKETDKKEKEVKETKIETKSEEIIEMPSKKVKKSDVMVETKILDQSEVLNIKDILENDDDSNVELDELMTPAVQMIRTSDETKKKEKKKKVKKVDESPTLQADAVIDTLTALPVDTLKGLLAGATIKVSIKFPKVK
jgi:hypothetical protein